MGEVVYEPARRLKAIFDQEGVKLVVFVEVAELEKIEASGRDPDSKRVKRQIRELNEDGHEIALHLHPQWCNAHYEKGKWVLDYSEYNLCTLSKERIVQIVERSVTYLRDAVGAADFTPHSFRAGNWLFQPTETAAIVLATHGVKLDSSVFKGGLQSEHGLDYRVASKNGYFWRFQADVNIRDPKGALLEIPIYTRMVPFWKMATMKRIGLQQKGSWGTRAAKQRLYRLRDMARIWYPLKLDFCRMTLEELIETMKAAIGEDQRDPSTLKPLVAIGHTKDLSDHDTVGSFLAFLKKETIAISRFKEVHATCV